MDVEFVTTAPPELIRYFKACRAAPGMKDEIDLLERLLTNPDMKPFWKSLARDFRPSPRRNYLTLWSHVLRTYKDAKDHQFPMKSDQLAILADVKRYANKLSWALRNSGLDEILAFELLRYNSRYTGADGALHDQLPAFCFRTSAFIRHLSDRAAEAHGYLAESTPVLPYPNAQHATVVYFARKVAHLFKSYFGRVRLRLLTRLTAVVFRDDYSKGIDSILRGALRNYDPVRRPGFTYHSSFPHPAHKLVISPLKI